MSGNPFIQSPYGHPNFNPVKVGARAAGMALDSGTPTGKSNSRSNKPSSDKQQSSGSSRYNRKQARQSEGKVAIQAEEEEETDDFSIKHVAAARYLRNHRLINEIFSSTVVPDVRNVMTSASLQKLRGSVQSMTMHQKKLECEIQQIEKKFEEKKSKLLESSEIYNRAFNAQTGPITNALNPLAAAAASAGTPVTVTNSLIQANGLSTPQPSVSTPNVAPSSITVSTTPASQSITAAPTTGNSITPPSVVAPASAQAANPSS